MIPLLQRRFVESLERITIFGLLLLLVFVLCQNMEQISVNENDELALFQHIQEKGFGIDVESDEDEDDLEECEDTEYTIARTSLTLIHAMLSPVTEIQIIEKTTQKASPIDLISNYSEFVNNQGPEFFEQYQKFDFEFSLQLMAQQLSCQTEFEDFGLTNFNAIGIVKIVDGGKEEFCVGTLVSDEAVITTAECVRNEIGEIYFQPSWVKKHVWLPFRSHQTPGNNDSRYNFAVFYLQEKLVKPPQIQYNRMMIQRSKNCYITLLGWRQTLPIFFMGGSNYKMVNCPHLPGIEQQLNIESTNCEEYCDLNEMDFQTGSPLILTCQTPKISHSLIGMLSYKELIGEKSNFLKPQKIAVPYMFTEDIFLDLMNAIEQSG